jgi:hypothetical protein
VHVAVARGGAFAYLRSFLIFSISPGSLLANVSFSDYNWHGQHIS